MIAAIRPGATFAGYRVESLVGRGGMGVVYRAWDLSLERPVALKLIAPELAQDERFRARFLREPRLAASLDHPGVVPIYEAGEWEGQLYLSMRFVEGSDLKSVLERDGTLPPERALVVLAQVADALDAAHRRGLVHRDVKPGNVLLDEAGHAYLTDFGITKQVGGVSTDTGRVVGTLDYLAPEQIRGEGVDGRTDCYALGCVLYECLSGAPPFRRATEAETLWAHMQDEPAALPDHPRLAPVLRKGLAKGPEERYDTCAELIDAAAEALGLAGPLAGRRLSRITLLLVLGGVLLGAAAVLALTRSLGEDASGPRAPLLDVATNSVGAVDVSSSELVLAAPLPGRPTDVAAAGDAAWVATVDSTSVTGVSARTRSISRTVPLPGRADAVAVGEGSVWIADGGRGVVSRIEAGYERVTQRFRVAPSREAAQPSGRLQAPRASLAVGGGAVWLANGSERLVRIGADTGETAALRVGRRVEAVAAGGGAVWALSSRSASVLRVDAGDGSVTDTVSIAARPGAEAPFPVAVAVTSRAVWVLNGNTATVTQIDPRTLGVVTTIPIGVDRVPTDIAAGGSTAWVSNGDGSIARIQAGAGGAREIRVGESLERVAAAGANVWVTTTAFDQKLPGGAG
ncbi:MAG: protein kinase domain-containing protein [Thermoleophilaceae bacterium]